MGLVSLATSTIKINHINVGKYACQSHGSYNKIMKRLPQGGVGSRGPKLGYFTKKRLEDEPG